MVSASSKSSAARNFPLYGYLGFLVIVIAEALLWTGYILLVDALVFVLKARSLLMTDRLELLVIVVSSIGTWWLCELYNAPRFWKSDLELWWHYHNVEP